MKRILLIAALVPLSACGARGPLTPPQGQALPTAPYGATATPAADDLLKPPPRRAPAAATISSRVRMSVAATNMTCRQTDGTRWTISL
ncbi:hypothetical protein AB2M62_18475 [Sphingomonas sp. MMS12-HWE2-04]|uniref:hypothetical protein n=1 Tax=Sphingomonas sp. MMS12-HWE2-04 TaxID=3234199 RepID=UPI00384F81EB